MKVVLPLPAMPTQTMATGASVEEPVAGAEPSGAFAADIVQLVLVDIKGSFVYVEGN